MSKNETERNINLLNPIGLSAEASRWAGVMMWRGVQAGHEQVTRFGRGILHFVDPKRIVPERVTRWYLDEQEAAVKEIVKRPNDYELVDLNAMRYVRTAMAHAEDQEGASAEYIEQIEKIMRDSGVVAEATIEKAVSKLRDTELQPLAQIITLESVMGDKA